MSLPVEQSSILRVWVSDRQLWGDPTPLLNAQGGQKNWHRQLCHQDIQDMSSTRDLVTPAAWDVEMWAVHLPSPWASLDTCKVLCLWWKLPLLCLALPAAPTSTRMKDLLCWILLCIQGVVCSRQRMCILYSEGIQASVIDTERPCAIFLSDHHHRCCPGAVTNFHYSFFQHLIHMWLNQCSHASWLVESYLCRFCVSQCLCYQSHCWFY